MLRAVLDVNVLVAGTITPKGAPGEILRQWQAGAFTLVTCEHIIRTYEAVLARPKIMSTYRGITAETIAVSGTALRAFAEVVAITSPTPRVVRDEPDDDIVLYCAVTGQADYVVTGDRDHLLPLGEHQGIAIVTPAGFVEILREDLTRRASSIEEDADASGT
ncbi:MAG: putative toxin-antitoxin system toxin component, PIN family [Armatimonadetes bacterium]|nr:putative toxin-antitoxin system toxin component, PIN family [Armatimonadota bacterium]